MRSSATLFLRAVSGLTSVVTKNGTSTMTCQLGDARKLIIVTPAITSLNGLLEQMQGLPIVGRAALAVAHKDVIPANPKALHKLYNTIDPERGFTNLSEHHTDFPDIFRELDKIRFERSTEAYDAFSVKNTM